MRLLITGSGHYRLLDPYLRRIGVSSVLLCTYRRPNVVPLSMATRGYHLAKEDGPDEILRIALEEKVDAALSASMPERMNMRDSRAAELLKEHGVTMLTQSESFIALCQDKVRVKDRLREEGFPVVPGYLITDFRSALHVAQQIGFPMICKPVDGWAGNGVSVVQTEQQLAAYLCARSGLPTIVEPLVLGTEFSVETLECPGGRLAMPPVMKGTTSATGSHAMERLRVAPYPCDGLQSMALEMAGALGSRLAAEFEFIVTAEGPLLLEVNPRLSTVTRLSSLASGLNTLELMADMALGRWDLCARQDQPRIAVDIPIVIDETLYPNWDDMICDLKGVFGAERFAVGQSTGRVTVAGSVSEISAAYQKLRKLGICDFCDVHQLGQRVKTAAEFLAGGQLVRYFQCS